MLKTGIILAFIFSIGSFAGCSGDRADGNTAGANSNAANASLTANTARDNIEELGLLVNLPFEADEATWKDEGNKLTAILRFTAEDTRKILASIEGQKPAEPISLNPERWFPADLIAQSEMNGDNLLKGNAYSAQDFVRPPYSDGRITKIENSDYLVLELQGK